MNVELPNTGCNILHSSTAFYNYSVDGRTREDWQIYEGVAHKISEAYNQYGYTYSGTCLSTGDLVYKPELKGVWFPIVGIIAFVVIVKLIINLFRGRL